MANWYINLSSEKYLRLNDAASAELEDAFQSKLTNGCKILLNSLSLPVSCPLRLNLYSMHIECARTRCLGLGDENIVVKCNENSHVDYLKLKRVGDYSWSWFDGDKWIELDPEDLESIEDEYQSELNGTRSGQKVYHCFGNGWSSCVNFSKMSTYCASNKCFAKHKENSLTDDHLTFRLKRETIIKK